MIYTVLKIEEDPDYGCEERTDDQPVTALVTLRSPGGEESTCRMPDQHLYDNDINDRNTDITGFVNWMQAAKSGKEIRKVCPFCGGRVGVISNRDGHTVIGCNSCDMRIELDGASL